MNSPIPEGLHIHRSLSTACPFKALQYTSVPLGFVQNAIAVGGLPNNGHYMSIEKEQDVLIKVPPETIKFAVFSQM